MLKDEELKKYLNLLRAPFKKNQISKLPKPTRQQTEQVKADYKLGIRCAECGAFHHKDVVHLDYVGHAALTDRLLDVDPLWSWEPLAFSSSGLPLFDDSGGLWIKLTILGITRLGYGHAKIDNNKDIGSREKEVIGDALRNAAMRFGAALDLWHKGDLHSHDVETASKRPPNKDQPTLPELKDRLARQTSLETLQMAWVGIPNKYKVQELINFAGECKHNLMTVEQRIKDTKTKDELINYCNTLTEQQQVEHDISIAEQIDKFSL